MNAEWLAAGEVVQFPLVSLSSVSLTVDPRPVAISRVKVLIGQPQLWWQAIPVFLSLLLNPIVSFYVMAAAARVQLRLGETGVRIMTRLAVLVLAAVAARFVLSAISDVWPGKGQPQA
jgi:multiple antibiotic resistance protein